MPFKHKLSRRLSATWLGLVAIILIVVSCEPRSLVDPVDDDLIAQLVALVIQPKSPTVTVHDSLDFNAVALTSTGDTTVISVEFYSSAEDGVEKHGRALGRFKSRRPGKFEVVVQSDTGNLSDTTEVTVVPAAPDSLLGVSGDGLSATINTDLAEPLCVKLVDRYGNAIAGNRISFAVRSGGGSLSRANVTTDSIGEASTTWTLGSVRGTQSAEATVHGFDEIQPASFSATGTPVPGESDSAFAVSGGGQTAEVGSTLANPLVVRVVDGFDSAVEGVSVVFAATYGGGSVSPTSVITNSAGEASTRWTLGSVVGSQAAVATISGITDTPIAFAAIATSATPVADSVLRVSGDRQSGTVSSTLSNPLVIRVLDQFGNAIQGEEVSFSVVSGGGSVSTTRTTTGVDGEASTTWTLGATAGTQRAQAAVSGIAGSPVGFSATATAVVLDADSMFVVSGDNQTGMVNARLSNPLVVRVVDELGNAVANETVRFSVTSGGGSVSPTSTTSNANGEASATWTLGSNAGQQTAAASVTGLAGSPVALSATANSYPAGESEQFPPYSPVPTVADLNPNPDDEFYCSTNGSNTTGDGSINNPWYDLIGAQTGGSGSPAGPGDIIYFRAGTWGGYPRENTTRSRNMLSSSGSSGAPIIITNYPGEIARWAYRDHWCMTLDGDFLYLVGTHVGSEYGIQIAGGMTVRGDNEAVINVEFTQGSDNGDGNPAMLSVPLISGMDNLLVSHNYFHDPVHPPAYDKMMAFRSFTTSNMVVEYNVFENTVDVDQGGNIYFKDANHNSEIRYNKFLNVYSALSFTNHGITTNGINFHHNLIRGARSAVYFINRAGPNIRIHNNVALDVDAFFYYLNVDNYSEAEHGDYYDNVIDGPAFERGWHVNGNDYRNLPDYFDYNLWYSASDQNMPGSYHDHAIVGSNSVTYYSGTNTVSVSSNYAGRGNGRYGGTIGGFIWN